MENGKSHTVLFITGAFVSHQGWDDWRDYFEQRGYKTLAPPWPHKDASPDALRARHPDATLAGLRFPELVEHHARIARGLPEKPILIGHSTGGLIVQKLLQQDLGVAGVAIHSLPPQGVIPLAPSFYKAALKSLGLFSSADETYLMSFKEWQYAFTNGMPYDVQRESYDRNVVPESKRMARGAISSAARIDFKKPHAPLLFLAGDEDNIIPASLNRANFRKYKGRDGASITEYKEFPGRNHYVLSQPTWREDAEYVLRWVEEHQQEPALSPTA